MDDKDTATILAELREEIRRRRERLGGTGPAAGEPGSAAWSLNELRKSLDEVNDLWFVSAHLPMTWTSPVGHVLAYAKRLARLLLRWYINPIVEQQNLYNSAVARTLVEADRLRRPPDPRVAGAGGARRGAGSAGRSTVRRPPATDPRPPTPHPHVSAPCTSPSAPPRCRSSTAATRCWPRGW